MTAVVAYCRGGFERESAEELRGSIGPALSIAATPDAGFVIGQADPDARTIDHALARNDCVFVRSVFVGEGPVTLAAGGQRRNAGPKTDRVSTLLAALDRLGDDPLHAAPWRSMWIEHPDTNEGKALSPLARALAARIEGSLVQHGALDSRAPRRLHVFLVDGATAFVGTSDAASGSPWPLGIPRLHMPRAAPSRATQKLAEAIIVFLGDRAGELLRPGMRAVDLGAAPGGWTWQLVQRGLRVTAVDNGELESSLARDPMVVHLREDGLAWRPRKAVDWLVCDIVLAPSRIAELVARWIAERHARRAIFNLKLPMKKRLEAVHDARSRIANVLARAGVPYELRLRQLYHDRAEVTGYLARVDAAGRVQVKAPRRGRGRASHRPGGSPGAAPAAAS